MRDFGELRDLERQRDLAICGCDLSGDGITRFADEGAHDPTPTHYFVLEDLFARMELDGDSRLLDVGCGAGRALAYFVEAGCAGAMTGVELDPVLARRAAKWAASFPQLEVVEGSAVDMPLAGFTHFYLFNPFDSCVLERFVQKLEADVAESRESSSAGCIAAEAKDACGGLDGLSFPGDGPLRPKILCHMSDNGECYLFWGRPGWHLEAAGEFQYYEGVRVFDYPQHWSIWGYLPES